jgi:hypothetical protein
MSRLSIFAAAAVLSALTATPAAFAREHHHVRKAAQYIWPSEARRETLAGTGVAQRDPNSAFAYDRALQRFQRTVTPITRENPSGAISSLLAPKLLCESVR